MSLLILARSLSYRKRLSEAIELTERAKSYAGDVKDREGLGRSSGDLGDYYSMLGRFNDAIMLRYVAMEVAVVLVVVSSAGIVDPRLVGG